MRMALPLATLLCLGISLSLYDDISVASFMGGGYAISVSLFKKYRFGYCPANNILCICV